VSATGRRATCATHLSDCRPHLPPVKPLPLRPPAARPSGDLCARSPSAACLPWSLTAPAGGATITDMKVPDEIRKSVAFVGYQVNDQIKLAGTAFFAADPIADTEASLIWLVTAAHVINGIRTAAPASKVYVRMNTCDGGTTWLETDYGDWIIHNAADLAVLNYAPSHDLVDYRVAPLGPGGPATDEIIQREGIGVGDEVFLAGLFINHVGSRQNIPIVRMGNIAAMPGEPIHLPRWGSMAAYLVEARSIGGLSGSPVFVHLGVVRYKPGDPSPGLVTSSNPHGNFYLIGVMHGHFDGRLTDVDATPDDFERERVNMGIAIVVPVQCLLELLATPELQTRKDRLREEFLAKRRAVPETADSTGAIATEH